MTKKVNISPALLRAKDAAPYLGLARSTFLRWVQEGKLPQGTRLSARCTVWKKSILDEFVQTIEEQEADTYYDMHL